ncbi:MAG: alpha-glucosidase [Clostridiaceae bacterium]
MNKTWWKEAVVYQIYPRSFKDSNNDGIGDINGIIEKLDYIKNLGATMIWLNPIYKSPNDDNGYDISDYRDIMDEFGTLEDFNNLLEKAHEKDIKIMMDLVVNHTSDEHEWFKESKKSRDNKYRDYYIWKKSKDGVAPTNWHSFFGGSTWEYDENTEEYYLHLFSKKQPDLNWENPKVRQEVYDLMKFWLDKGVDGFRMDVINAISKDQSYPEGTIIEGYNYGDGSKYYINGPKVHEFLKEMNKEVLSKYDAATVGETPNVDPDEALKYVGEDRDELNMLFQFDHMSVLDGKYGKWSSTSLDLVKLKNIMSKWQTELYNKGWNSLYWNNHDQPRVLSRFGDDTKYKLESAKMLGTCLHMMQGTPYIYQGEELGMSNVYFDNLKDYKDIETFNAYKELVDSGIFTHKEMMDAIHKVGRDNARTPMQWNNSENAGFSKAKPWIAVNPNYKNINTKDQINDENSVLNYYKKLIKLRKKNEVIVYGKYKLLLENDKNIFAYTRTLANEVLLTVCNFSSESQKFYLKNNLDFLSKKLLITNYNNYNKALIDDVNSFQLNPYEARVYLLTK